MKVLAGSLVALRCSLNRRAVRSTRTWRRRPGDARINLLQCADVSAALTAVTNQDTRLRDWANLGRYREANKTVTRADAVFMGDSITDFWQQPSDSADSSRERTTPIAASARRRRRRCSSGSGPMSSR